MTLDGVQVNSLSSIGGTGIINGGGSDSPAIKIEIKFTEKDKFDYLKAQGLSEIEAQKFIKEHSELVTREDFTNYFQKQNVFNGENATKNATVTTTQSKVNFKEFSNADIKTKFDVLVSEYAKNQNLENWDNLSDAEKQSKTEAAMNTLITRFNKSGNNLTFEQMKESIENPENLKQLSPEKKAVIENIMSDLFLDIQVSDDMQMTIEDFYELDNDPGLKSVLISRKYEYIEGLKEKDNESFEALGVSAKEFYDIETTILEAFKAFKDKKITCDCLGDIDTIIENYNSEQPDENKQINRASVVYEYLSEKVKKGEKLTENEQKLLDHYEKVASKSDKTRIPLNKLPDFDPTNKSFIQMYKSEVYQKACLEAKNNKVPDVEQYAEKAYLQDYIEQYISKNTDKTKDRRTLIQNAIREFKDGASLAGRDRVDKILELLRNDRTDRILHDDNGKQIVSTISDIHDIILKSENTDADDLSIAYDNGIFAKEECKNIGTFVGILYAEAGEGKKDDVIKLGRFSSMDDKIVTDTMHSAGWSKSAVKHVGDDFTDNFALYNQEARISRTGQYGYWYQNKADAVEAANKLQQVIVENKDDPGIGDVYEAYGGSASSYIPEAQVTVANNVMSMSEYFDDESNIRAQSALANDVQNCDVENQLEIHSTIMNNSQYDEVLELTASNIHNYDESVQAGAIEVTYATGNESAIRACEGQLDQCKGINASEYSYSNYSETQNSINTVQDAVNNLDLSNSEDRQKFLDLVENNGADVSRYLVSCSEKDKANFVEKYCKIASESQLINFVKNNPSMCDLILRYSNGLNKEKLFGVLYNGNKGQITKILNQLEIKGNSVLNLARTYKEFAPDIAIETQNSELARSIVTNPDEWGYQLGRPETQDLRELASKEQIIKNDQNASKLNINDLESLDIFGKNGIIRI